LDAFAVSGDPVTLLETVFRVRAQMSHSKGATSMKLTFNNATLEMEELHGFCPQKNK